VVGHAKNEVTCRVHVARDLSDKGPRWFLNEYDVY